MNLRSRITAITAAVALACLMLATPALSSSLAPPLNLPDMVGRADRIVVGRALDEWTGRDEHGIPATITTFAISRVHKGGPIRTLKVKQFGVTRVQSDGLAAWIDGMPRYEKGRDYLLFLNPDSRLGFTMPVGAFQGAFEIRGAGGGRAAVNGVNNANLLRGLDEAGLERLRLSAGEFPFVGRGNGPMRLDELEAMIDRLAGAR